MALAAMMSCALPAAEAPALQPILQALQSGQIAEGQKLLQIEKKRAPQNVELRLLEGVLQAQSGQKEQALETFLNLAKDHPQLPEVHNNLGVLYAQRGELELARASFEKALQTHSSYAAAQKNLMDLNARLAKRAYARALQLDDRNKPSATEPLIMLAAQGPLRNELAVPETAKPRPAEPPVQAATPTATSPARTAATAAANVPPPRVADPVTRAPTQPVASQAPARPTAQPKLPAPPGAADNQAIEAAVKEWARSWSARNVEGYLAHYAPSFEPPNGMTRSLWAKERRSRISSRKFIRVSVSRLQIDVKDKAARVKLAQQYESDGLNTSSRKTLEMVKVGGRWLIVQERVN
jgi:tetratricopeptide (TPR) repeat protein